MEEKILTIQELSRISQEAKALGKTVAHCHGCWDLVHMGHVVHLQEARAIGGQSVVLIVTVTSEEYVAKQKGPHKSVYKEATGTAMLASLECVDYVAVNPYNWKTAPNSFAHHLSLG